MKFLQKIKFWLIILVSGILQLNPSVYASGVDEIKQFLEVINNSNESVIILLKHGHSVLSTGGLLELVSVSPGDRKRVMGALRPGRRDDLLIEYGDSGGSFPMDGIFVNNYGNKTYLHGKQLTISKTGGYNIKPVQLLHGVWRIKKLDLASGRQEWELDLSHVNSEFDGSVRSKSTGEKTTIKGRMVGRVAYFSFGSVPGTNMKVSGEVKITADGIWRGKLYLTSMEKGGYTCNTVNYRDPENPDAAGWVVAEESGKVLTLHVGNRNDMFKSIYIRVHGIAQWKSMGVFRFLRIGDHWNDAVEDARQRCQKWKEQTDTSRRKTRPLTIEANFHNKTLVIRY